MKTAVALTQEIDDLNLAAEELAGQIRRQVSLRKNTVGIVYCDADVDVAAFGALLRRKLDINIVGLTSTATLERNNGYCGMGILLSVLTADDVDFSVGSTGDLIADGISQVIGDAYAAARARLSEDPKLILAFSSYLGDITSDRYVNLLSDASGGVPVFGGVATDHYDLLYQKVLCNESAYTRGLVFVLISGDIDPIFSMEHHFGAKVEKKGVITKSEGNSVLRVGDQTFKAFLASMVPVPDDDMMIFHLQSTPFILELPDHEDDEQPVVRALCTLDHETGAGGFLSEMPEGSRLSLSMLHRDNLRESCDGALTDLLGRIRDNAGRQYSMVFIVSCNARHLLMGDEKNLESDILARTFSVLPPELNAVGFYGFGEFCPTGKRADGTAKNRFHNISLAVCAI